jgi:hypothetical protein
MGHQPLAPWPFYSEWVSSALLFTKKGDFSTALERGKKKISPPRRGGRAPPLTIDTYHRTWPPVQCIIDFIRLWPPLLKRSPMSDSTIFLRQYATVYCVYPPSILVYSPRILLHIRVFVAYLSRILSHILRVSCVLSHIITYFCVFANLAYSPRIRHIFSRILRILAYLPCIRPRILAYWVFIRHVFVLIQKGEPASGNRTPENCTRWPMISTKSVAVRIQ